MAVEFLRQALRQEDVRVFGIPGSFGGRAEDLSPKALHGVDLLTGHLLRQADNLLVPLQGRYEAKPDACVATGGLDEDVTWLDATTLLRLLDHALGDAGLEELPVLKKTPSTSLVLPFASHLL